MQADTPLRIPARLQALAAMASLLQRLDGLPRSASAQQYREVASQVDRLLDEAEPGPDLDAVLARFPAAAEVYENRHYGHAGLCRSPLEAALNAELAATGLLRKLAAKPH